MKSSESDDDEQLFNNPKLEKILEVQIAPDQIITRLSEVVRKQYFGYLEKQLWRNVELLKKTDNEPSQTNLKHYVHLSAKILEEKAVKSCKVYISQLYQRAMINIINDVRQDTQNGRLEYQLNKILSAAKHEFKPKLNNKKTSFSYNGRKHRLQAQYKGENVDNNESISLHKKMKTFQQRVNKNQEISDVHKNQLISKGSISDLEIEKFDLSFTPPSFKNVIKSTPQSTIISPFEQPIEIKSNDKNKSNEDDVLDKELALLFSEEHTNLDEIFGIDKELIKPPIYNISNHMENSENTDQKQSPRSVVELNEGYDNPEYSIAANYNRGEQNQNKPLQQYQTEEKNSNLRLMTENYNLFKSLWPCELFMRRQQLTESLSRLLEEDFRWHEIIKWKFTELFGEDSDDEFAICSPSIELDEVLLNSCIRRISPWLVKYLMKPLKEGLIGNRYLFKKLAKKLADNIVRENQYPDERFIKNVVENFFCAHQAILSLDDLNDVSNIPLNNII